MKKIIIAFIILFVVIIGVYYYIFNNSSKQTTINTSYKNQQNTIIPKNSSSTDIFVNIKNFSFNPETLTIKKGTKVTWTNNDSAPHTVTFDSGVTFSSPTILPGETFNFIFNNIGTTNYHCSIHKTMKGKIIVIE